MSLLLSLTITITIVSLRQKIKIKKTDTNKIVQTNKQNNITLKPQNKVLFPNIYIYLIWSLVRINKIQST